jgi:undecaprenyl-phosphate galactose phosphotransferase/putative colanic acid biosynthesis UDP-glucose lipid carrier transferase
MNGLKIFQNEIFKMRSITRILTLFAKYIKIILLAVDVLVLNISFFFAGFLLFDNEVVNQFSTLGPLVTFSNCIWFFLIIMFRAYKVMRIESVEKILSKSIKMIISLIFILFCTIYLLGFSNLLRLYVLIFSVIFLLSNISIKSLVLLFQKQLRKKGLNNKKVVIVGNNENGVALDAILRKELSYGYKVLGVFTDMENVSGVNFLGKLNEIKEYIDSHDVDELFFTLVDYDSKKIHDLIVFCEKRFIRFKILPNFQKYTLNRRVSIDFYDDLPILLLRNEPLENLFNKVIKRLFDVLFSLTIIISILSWLYPIVAIMQKIFSKGPILFVQLRSGQDNIVFKCFKFRTMTINDMSDEMGTLDNDPRITPFGKILRKTRIDELPQFLNVLFGSMSVVGPRPHMLKHTEEYSELIDEFLIRHYVKPGITGWAQTTGYIDESRKLKEMQDKVKNDIYYIENWSFILDLKIIFLTIFNIFKGDTNAK